jgi:hypothetical protein
MPRGLLILPLLGVLFASCGGTKTIKADGAEKSVTDFVSRQTKFHPTDVSCPSGVKAEVGGSFDCHFTGPDGSYVAHVRIIAVEGEGARFYVKTARVSSQSQ